MDDTRELITAAEFSHALLLAAAALLVAAVAAGAVWGARRKSLGAGLLRGIAAGTCGPAALLLWRIYNGIEDRYGLDSVKALLINLGLFVVVGLAAGRVLQWVWRRTEGETTEPPPAAGEPPALAEERGGS